MWSHHFIPIDGKKVETVTDFIFLGSTITEDGDCSYDIKRHLQKKDRKDTCSLEENIWQI